MNNIPTFFIVITRFKEKSSGNAFASGSGGLKFNFLARQIGRRAANNSPPLRHFFSERAVLLERSDAEMEPTNLLHAWQHYSDCKEGFDVNHFSKILGCNCCNCFCLQ